MSLDHDRGAAWRWMAESPWFLRVIAPLLLFGVIAMFVRADLKNRECARVCKGQGHADGFRTGGRNTGEHCVCLDNQGRNVDGQTQKRNSNEE